MAGAGYKLFNTGDVLTAAQVNTYLMEQTTMVFADAAARTAALSGVVSEGMISYLKSTKQVEVYNGSAWVASDDPNAIQNTIVDAKGDLITATAADTPARLAVGNNGETVFADSSASTGLRWQPHIEAGKNLLINSGFDVWQRGTSATGSGFQSADRWWFYVDSGTMTASRESTIVPAGSTYSMKITANSAGTKVFMGQPVETQNAIRFAGQTITYSAQVAASTSVGIDLFVQWSSNTDNAAGGIWTTITATSGGSATPTSTTFVTASGVYAIPSNAKSLRFGFQHTNTVASGVAIYIGNVQAEIGSVATAFSRAAGTLAGELSLCQRYYWRAGGDSVFQYFGMGSFYSSTGAYIQLLPPVTLRTAPSALEYSTLQTYDFSSTQTITNITMAVQSKALTMLDVTLSSGGTQFRPNLLRANNSTSAYIALSAEL